jgi:exopolysaccharide biosynthesis polyprenyl glycosylphosphotransferase
MSQSAAPDLLPGTVEPALEPPMRSRPGGWTAHVVAEFGRVGLVFLAVAVVYASRQPVTEGALVAITVATCIWVAALRVASSPGVLVFGRGLSRALGVGIGAATIMALNGSALGLGIRWPWVAGAALGIWATTSIWERFVDEVLDARRRVLFVGTEGAELLLPEDLRRCRHSGFEILGSCSSSMVEEALPPVGIEELERVVEAQRPDVVVLTDERTFGEAVERLIDVESPVRVATLSSFFERVLGRVPVGHITPAWFLCLVEMHRHVYSRHSKRVFDVLAATVGLILAAPILAVMALVTKTTPGPVLFRQTRVGERGRLFTVLKIRTMSCDAEAGGAAFTCDDDPRVTRVGRVLRKTHLDELPQLWNVIKGDMSMVGPRPEQPEFIEMIEAAVPFWNRRVLVKPGVTGWAQILGDYASDCNGMARKLSYDLWYLRHGSVLVDLAICVETIGVQLRALTARNGHACALGKRGIGR